MYLPALITGPLRHNLASCGGTVGLVVAVVFGVESCEGICCLGEHGDV